jgi:hypothetical protein
VAINRVKTIGIVVRRCREQSVVRNEWLAEGLTIQFGREDLTKVS